MKFVTRCVGVLLLLVMSFIPLGCEYATKKGPEWMHGRRESGVVGTAFLLALVFAVGGVSCILATFCEPPKNE